MSRTVLVLVAVALWAPPAAAQTSAYGVLGVGFPGRYVGARARALGGGPAATDGSSAANPAAAAFRRLTAAATGGTSLRRVEAGGNVTGGLADTRFPFALVGGPIQGTPLGFAVGYSTYADRSFDVTSADTVVLRGAPVGVEDRIRSLGAIADVRGAVAWEITPAFRVGVAAHLLSGSTRETIERAFSDSSYVAVRRRSTTAYSGAGMSLGLLLVPVPQLRLGAAVRTSSRLTATRDSLSAGSTSLPMEVTAGVHAAPAAFVRWSATVAWRSWSRAQGQVGFTPAANAFDTWEIGSGLELGQAGIPLRLGIRYAQLPFSPIADRGRELDVSAGTGLAFAAGRGTIDVAVERVLRDGAGASERVWQITAGLTVRPGQ